MSKIFRLYKEGTSTYEDWNNSPSFPYNSSSRDTIEDPDGASAKHEITSIPSPFARIDLIKNAFKEICKPDKKTKKINLDGRTIFHKMVSDTLDVAEIFFNIDKYKGLVEIIKWDPSLMLQELDDSRDIGHRYLSDALRKYLKSDAKTYNFGQLKNIYLLNYVNGPDELNIIGATSPSTLFFSNANELDYINDIFFGEDRPFDSEYQPLYKRDFEFVKYMFALRAKINGFASLFPEIDTYLTATFRTLNDAAQKEELRDISTTVLDKLSTITVKDIQQNDIVEVLGFSLYKKSQGVVSTTSEFTIDSTKITEQKPLVLPIESGNRYSELYYTTGKWGKTNVAPYQADEKDLAKRALPFDGSIHPFITISDLLEDTIIRVPHTMNSSNYFVANINIDKSELSYLLPFKPMLFEYFSVEELRQNREDGKPMVEMSTLAGEAGVSVTLRIPIKGNSNIKYIEYTRLYYKDRSADVDRNEGGMTEFKFTGFIMPLIRFNNVTDAIYNVSCVQYLSDKTEFLFYKQGQKLSNVAKSCRNEGEHQVKSDNYFIENSDFDCVQIRNRHGYCGMMIPIFKPQRNVEVFEFAIDLGTSNTHIEYRKGTENSKVFAFASDDRHLCEMFLPTYEDGAQVDLQEKTELIEKDFIPGAIGENDYYFPTRTVLSCSKTIDWTNTVEPFTLVNLPFTYDKRSALPYNNFKYNIKWGKGDENSIIEAYVNCLMLIIRNKVLLNNGDLQRTKITWFYPISMAPKRLRNLKQTWDAAYTKYFGTGATSHMTESSAPIQYFFKRYATATSLVNVDIGGGTTDIAFAKNKEIQYVTSFRFASNALFENSFSGLDEHNGIIDWHKNEILKLLEEKHLSELTSIFNSPNNQHPANMASFLFGLKDNSIPKRESVNPKSIDFNHILQEDENFKIVFILFYTSIIYHIAQITKSLNLDVPRHISFSGNGSKVVRIVTTDTKILANYTKRIFEKVLEKPYGKELELLGLEKDSNPKESTCKGGIICTDDEDQRDRAIVFKSDCSGIVNSTDTYDSIDEFYKKRTIAAVESFFNFALIEMNSAFNFDDNFGVTSNSLRIAIDTAKKDLETYLDKGISQRCEEAEASDIIEETFFYYPIKGVLQAISNEIYKSLQN